ncbi:hypothetical protein [Pseudophaeobacter sp. C1-32P7]|uniref:hypothetical protein n=1 Tax=Pseudophaeobacter sp. C1-32P7 TaxID=3098142 RepID=UPI0034D67B09
MLRLKQEEVTVPNGELADILFGHSGNHARYDTFETLAKGGHGIRKLHLDVVGQNNRLRFRFLLPGGMLLPEIADPRQLAPASKFLVNIPGGHLAATLVCQHLAGLDDFGVGMNGFAHRFTPVSLECRREVGAFRRMEKQTFKLF